MGGGPSCPECPKCEQKKCPECPKCDNSWSMVDDIKRIPVSGTPFTILKIEITGINNRDDIREATRSIQALSPSLVIFISPNRYFMESDKMSVVALQAPYNRRRSYTYGDRSDYEKLKKASTALNKVLKEYTNQYIVSVDQSIDGAYSSIIRGTLFTKRYDEYQPLITKEEMPDAAKLLGPSVFFKDDIFILMMPEISINDVDLRIVALIWNNSDVSTTELLYPEKSTERFRTFSNSYYSLITTIIVLIFIGISIYLLFGSSDKMSQRINLLEKPATVNE